MNNVEKSKTPLLNVYSLQDVVAGRFHPPFLSENHNTAKRMLYQAVNTKDSQIYNSPDDFRLWHIGDFDQDDGQLDVKPTSEIVVPTLRDLLAPDSKNTDNNE